MNEQKTKTIIQVVTVLCVILIIVLMSVLLLQSVQLNVMEKRRAKLLMAIDRINEEIVSIEQEIENRKTEAFIEKYARENLGMIKKGEIVFKPE